MPRISILLFVVLFATELHAQEPINYSVQRIIPPSPTAASIAKYGDIPVSYYTGIPNISIPLYTVKNRDVSVPLTLNYHSGGIRVDEEASWVGLGWSLMAGGVITRTVRGGDDLGDAGYPDSYIPTSLEPASNTYIEPTDLTQRQYDREFLGEVLNGMADGEPDAFVLNFNGRSAKFFLNKRSNPSQPIKATLVSQEGIQIETSFSTTALNYRWVVTDESGAKFYFGTVEKSISRSGSDTDEYMADQNTLDGTAEEVVTSWYLDSIVSPTGAKVQFNYMSLYPTGYGTRRIIAKSQVKKQIIALTGDVSCTLPSNIYQYSSTLTDVHDVYLKEIVFPNGKVDFIMSDRSDIEPVPGPYPPTYAKKLDTIVVTADSKIITKRAFAYAYFGDSDYKTKRLKLLKVTETTGAIARPPHEFTYNSTDLPAKDSKGIDHWGYFNNAPNERVNDLRYGDVSVNGTLIPPTWVQAMDGSLREYPGANRDPSPFFTKACTLTDISYPTGGTTHFEFENNEYYEVTRVIDDIVEEALLEKFGPATGQHNYRKDTVTIVLPKTSKVNLYNTLTCWGETPCLTEGTTWEYDFAHVVSVGSTPPLDQWYGFTLTDETQWLGESESIDMTLPAGTYKFTVFSEGSYFAQMLISTRYPDTSYIDNNTGGGLRVKSILTYDGVSHDNDQLREFEYKMLQDGERKSSGTLMVSPVYTMNEIVTRGCSHSGFPVTGEYFTRSSSPLVPFSNAAQGNSIGYSEVDEIISGIGKTVYEYYNAPDATPYPFSPNVPTTPSLGNGLLSKQTIYKEAPDESYIKVKEIETVYAPDYSRDYSIMGMKVPGSAICNVSVDGYPNVKYSFLGVTFYTLESQFWHQVDEVVTTYSQTTQEDPLITTSHFKYDHPDRLQITGKDVIDSRGRTESSTFKYPYDFPSDPVCAQMVAKNQISSMIEQTELIGTAHKQTLKAAYNTWNGMQLPEYIQVKNGNGNLETRLRYQEYSDKGLLLSQSKENDVRISYKWGYSDQYPVAEVTNAQPNEFYYESFEEGVNMGTLQADARTGDKIKAGSFTVNFAPPNSKAYVLSYWYKTSAAGAWLYKERAYTGASAVISDGVWVDEVRVHPKDAQMITRSFAYMIGVTSETDASGKTLYYEYNDFNDLKLIRDQDGRIVKQFDYQYDVNP